MQGEGGEEYINNGNLFLYLIVFVLLSLHSSFILLHIFIKHLSEGILLLMLGFEEETVFHICIAVMQHKNFLRGKKNQKKIMRL